MPNEIVVATFTVDVPEVIAATTPAITGVSIDSTQGEADQQISGSRQALSGTVGTDVSGQISAVSGTVNCD